jgi:hypothetical protein
MGQAIEVRTDFTAGEGPPVCQAGEGCRAGAPAAGGRCGARRRFAGRSRQDRWDGPSDVAGLGDPVPPTRSWSSIRPAGTAPRTSRYQATYRSCRCRHLHLNSTAKKTSGSSCVKIGCQTEASNPSTTLSITAATPGTPSSINPGKSCRSHIAIGQSSVTQSEDWY